MKAHYPNFRETLVVFLFLAFGFTRGQLPSFDITTTKNLLSNNGDSRLDENGDTMLNNAKNTALITKYESPYRNFFNITNPNSSLKRSTIVYGADGITNGARACEVNGGDTVINVKINDNENTIGPIDASNTGTYTESNYFYMGISINDNSPSLFVNKVTFAPYTTYVYKSSSTSGFNSKIYFNTYYRIGIVNITDSPKIITWVTDNLKLRSCAIPNGNPSWDKEVKVFFKSPYNTWGYEMLPNKSYEIRFYVSRSNEAPYTYTNTNTTTTSLPNYFKKGTNYLNATSFSDNSAGENILNTIPSGYSNLNNDRVYYDNLTTPPETRFTTLIRRTDNPMVYGSIGPPSISDKEIPCGTTSIATSDIINSNDYAPIPTTTRSLNGGSYNDPNSGKTFTTNDSQIALRIYNSSGTDVTNNATLGIGTYYAAYMYDDDNTTTGTNFSAKRMASVTYKEFHITQKTTTWNGSSWNNGTPTLNTMVILDGDYDTSINGNLLACNLTVNNGKKLNITKDNYVKVNNNIVNNNTDVNNFIVQSDGNLVQLIDSGTFTGNPITVKRDADLNRLDYVLWGSPVIGANVRNFSPATLDTRFYVYNETNDYYDGLFVNNIYPLENTNSLSPLQNPLNYNFIFGKGYGIRAPNTYPDKGNPKKTFHGTFIGIPNTGDSFKFTIQKSQNKTSTIYSKSMEMGNNLITNPYPSNIDLEKFYTLNSGIIYKQFYFWTNTNYNPPMQGVNYPSNLFATKKVVNNYSVYNGSGGLTSPFGFSCTQDTDNTTVGCNPIVTLNNIVKPGQAFIVKSKVTAPTGSTPTISQLNFNNSIRTESNTNSKFYSRMSKNESVDRFWLTLKTPIAFITPILIAYKEEATNDYELDYDAEPLVEAGDSFYSIIPEHNLSIQGRKGPFNINDKILLGTVNGMEGSYTISLNEKEGIFANGQGIYLTDHLNNMEVNLQEQPYTFYSASGTFNNRFEISYSDNSTLTTTTSSKNFNFELYPNPAKEILNLHLDDSIKDFSFEISDSNGRVISITKNQKQINTSQLKPGIYIGTLETEKGTVNKKFIIQ